MFLCVSLNPAIDKRVRLKKLLPGHVNRVTEILPAPGGKAAHVAMVLQALGADPLWIGFAGGSSGQELLEGLGKLNIRSHPVPIGKATRTNLEIIEESGVVTEILEPGPSVSSEETTAFRDAFRETLSGVHEETIAILSGSLPPGMPAEIYPTLIRIVREHGGKVVLDTSNEALRLALAAGPDLVKPNREEAEWLTGGQINDPGSAAKSIEQPMREGAKSVAISLGEQGLVWRPSAGKTVYYVRPVKISARSCVGSGDAAVAAFAFALASSLSPEETIRLAAACGAANCLADSPGRARADDIRRLQQEVRVEILS